MENPLWVWDWIDPNVGTSPADKLEEEPVKQAAPVSLPDLLVAAHARTVVDGFKPVTEIRPEPLIEIEEPGTSPALREATLTIQL